MNAENTWVARLVKDNEQNFKYVVIEAYSDEDAEYQLERAGWFRRGYKLESVIRAWEVLC